MEVAQHPGDREAHAQHHEHRQPRARGSARPEPSALSLINTINSITGVDLDTFEISPNIGGKGGHGGYAGPAVKPIALNMLSSVGTDRSSREPGCPSPAMGGITTWKDAAEFLLLGAGSLQVCTAVMHYGFRIIEDLCDGLSNWMDSKGFALDRRRSGPKSAAHFRLQGFRSFVSARWRASIRRSASSAICATSPATTPRTNVSIW